MSQLVIQTAYPGDLLLCIPLLKQIRKTYPNEPIVLLCRAGLGDLFLKEQLADEVIEVNKKDLASLKARLRDLRAREWTRVFCPHESFRSAFWVRGLRVREFSVGFHKWWNFWAFTKRTKRPMNLPDALRQLSLLVDVAALEIQFANPTARKTHSFVSEPQIPDWSSMAIRPSHNKSGPIFIAPGSVWPTKMWTEAGFTELARTLTKRGEKVIFVGSPAERELCERLAAATDCESLAGKTSIPELIELFRSGKILVSNDSGAMHAASVAGLATVAMFGPTVLEFGFRPWQSRSAVVQLDLNCRPCAAHGGRRCPIGTHACMRDLPAERVLEALDEIIQG